MSGQLPLAINLKDGAEFASFLSGANREAVVFLQNLPQSADNINLVYLWGEAGCGKSHLLQAVCHAASARSEMAVYLPMRLLVQHSHEALEDLEQVAVICIDDIDMIAGLAQWEDALLRLYVRAQREGCVFVVAARAAINQLGLQLDALQSRLHWGMVFQLQPLNETGKLAALTLRAERRGIKLPPESARYLLRHYGQDSGRLFAILAQLDQASLAAKRRLTIPFIKSALTQERN